MQEISVVAPIYNEEQTISEFVKQVTNTLNQISIDYEIILVDDGSNDNSWEKIKTEVISNSNIRGIKLSRNFGHHYAISAGLHKANAKWIVVMDSDLQDRPDVIKDLYTKAKEGYEVVFVSRINRPESFGYLFLQKIFYKLLNLFSGLKFNSRQANFSIIGHKVVDAFRQFPENARFYGSTIKWLGFKTTQINASHGTRFSGKPSYTFKKRVKLALDIILSFSDRPLKFAIYFGTFMASIAIIISVWIVWGALNGEFVVLGWASLMASIFFVGGSILIVLGILGIYLGRVFNEVKNRPLYVISDEI
jgi:glycosyltransferase involved in cell wall biosynthesis